MLEVTKNIRISLREFDFTFARSGGPGGQNVNKVNSKAVMFWTIEESEGVPESVKKRFIEAYAKRLSAEGVLVLQSDRFRDQKRNMSDCLTKLSEMLLTVATPPKRRKPTKPSKAAKRRRVDNKKKQGEKKERRKRIDV